MDWNGREGIFLEGELSVQELLDLTEGHFSFRPIPAPVRIWKSIKVAPPYGMTEEELDPENWGAPSGDSYLLVFGRQLNELDRERDRLEGRSPSCRITGVKTDEP